MKGKLNNPLIAIILILVAFIIAILATVAIWKLNLKPIERGSQEVLQNPNASIATEKPRNVCETPECITLAHQLLNWRDATVNPCDNFYKAACGNYIEESITDGTRNVKKRKVIKRLIKEFLIQNHKTESKSEGTMKLLYWKCEELKNETIYSVEHNRTMKEVFKNIQSLGAWPMIDKNWKASEFNIDAMLSQMAKFGHLHFGLFDLQVRHGTEMALIADYENVKHSLQHKIFEIISSILISNNISFNAIQIEKDIGEVYEFYEELKSNSTGTKGFGKLHELVPSIHFEKILKKLLNSKSGDWKKFEKKIENAEKVFKKFEGNKKISNGTLSKVLANYLVLKFIENSYSSFSISQEIAEDRPCDDLVINNLPRATLRAFVRNHFDRENIKIVYEMLEQTRKTYLQMIENTTWLSKEGKRRASLKISKMKTLIGYPKEYDEEGALDNTFETLHISSSDSFYTIMRKITRYRTELLMDYIAFDLSLDPMDELFDVNAYYASYLNQLSIMVPFIDEPNFDASYPVYAKFAVTGDILGHEMGHSLDPSGIHWNEDGNYEKWMPESDEKEYNKKVQCLMDQYQDYDDPDFGKNLDAKKVINEIIADRYGIDAALHTYKSLNISNDPKIIGYESFSPEKMIFHILALDYCAPRSTLSRSYVIEHHNHPTNSFRVNGIFSNLESFSKTFNCTVGSAMNRKKKCHLFVEK